MKRAVQEGAGGVQEKLDMVGKVMPAKVWTQ